MPCAYSLQNVHGTRASRICRIAHLRRRFIPLLQFHFVEVAGPPPEPMSIPVAPSALSFFSVASRWCSMTLRFLKYVTCPPNQHKFIVVRTTIHSSPIASSDTIIFLARAFPIVRTQLLAHALSNSLNSGAQAFLAFSSSRTLSMMLWRSRHLKKLSRPSQHCARAVRSGAMKPPSCEGAGGGGVGCAEEPPNQPMVDELKGWMVWCVGGCSRGGVLLFRRDWIDCRYWEIVELSRDSCSSR